MEAGPALALQLVSDLFTGLLLIMGLSLLAMLAAKLMEL